MSVFSYSTTPASNSTISGINISEGCSPAGINDAIRQLMADIAAGPTTLSSITSTVSFSNSTAANTLLTYSVPAGLLGTTRAVELVLFGDFTNNTGGSVTLELAGTYGGSTFFDIQPFSLGSNATARTWEIRALLQAHGATNAQFSTSAVRLDGASLNAAASTTSSSYLGTAYDNLAVDSTAAQNIVVKATMGTASASATVRLKGGIIRLA
jgi:hypothetical protein